MGPPELIGPMHEVHIDGGVLSYGGKLYVWGGATPAGGNYRSRVLEQYDPATGDWTLLTASPYGTGRSGMGEFELGGKLYFIGGEGEYHGTVQRNVLRYDPSEGSWDTSLNDFPQPAWQVMCAVVGGRAYAFGGRRGYGATYPEMWEYDELDDTWVSRAAMPYSVKNAGVGVCNDKIYVFGGNHKTSEASNEQVRHLQIYDVGTDNWEFQADAMPQLLMQVTAVAHAGEICVFGSQVYDEGLGEWVPCESVYVYSCATGSWDESEFIPPVYNLNVSPVGLVSGYTYFTDTTTTDAFRSELLPDGSGSVEIDIKPGSYPNSINLGSHGVIPVAILSSEMFDATQVDAETVELAGAGVAVRGRGNNLLAHEEDIDADRLMDLVVQVETENLNPDAFQDGYAILTGETYDGEPFEGSDEITIVP